MTQGGNPKQMKRRAFLTGMAAGAAGAGVVGTPPAAPGAASTGTGTVSNTLPLAAVGRRLPK